jgi:serine/threonine protein kinase/tetratricopeptide (TPR) repeat protein
LVRLVKFVSRACSKCGGEILPDVAEGLCTACLLETGLGLFAEAVGQLDDTGRGNQPPRSDIAAGNGSKVAPEMEALQILGDYELLEEIGRGGQGVVYRARQKSLNRTVALKVVRTDRSTTPVHLQRFQLEAETAASLDDPNIVPIYEVGEHGGSCYFSMKLVEGGRLDELFKREPMSIRPATELVAKLSRAVHYAHDRGILHRDIKPGNILLDAKGEPHLTDFGLARLTETESTVTRTIETLGTPSYMAPEQALGNNNQLTRATDVYGLGAVLYHLITGNPPFAGGTSYETIRLLLETEPRQPRLWNPKIDRDLATICLRALEKNPQHRYPSALALAEDLERWIRHQPIHARHTGVFGHGKKWVRRNPTIALLILSLTALTAAVSWNLWKSKFVPSAAATGVAVLPFENLSDDKENAFFADGVQDDVLTKLAKIADLKVVSRNSVMDYRSERNMREIGKALRVSHVLEGSVRKTGAVFHLDAQLIDTRTDARIWAEQYDVDLNQRFTIQSEIAQKIAQQLHAKISTAEALAIAQPITTDLTAFDLYIRARNLLLMKRLSASARANFFQAIDLLDAAAARDPTFFQAYCQLASAHGNLYFMGFDHTPARLALAQAAIQSAFRLHGDAGEAHLASAENLYLGHLDYAGALTELMIASKSLPNDPRLFELKGYIQRRQGKQEEALRNFERAAELDPRNARTLQQMALSYELVRRYPEAKLVWDRVLAVEPNDMVAKAARALVDFNWKADTRPLHLLIDSIRATNASALRDIADVWFICALAERDTVAAQNALTALGETPLRDGCIQLNRRFVEGIIARLAKDDKKAQFAFTAARAEQEKILAPEADYGPPLCVLGLIDAALGRKADALQEGRRAVELLPVEKDALNGMQMVSYFAMLAGWVGENDLACEQLAKAISHSSFLGYGQLKLLPFWDPLRGDPCFEEIVQSLAPK